MVDVKPWGRAVPFTTPTGVKVTLYNIGTLAEALGRTSQTVRKWEVSGVLPKTAFKDSVGRRLYSGKQIECIVKSAEKSKLQQGKKMSNLRFSPRVYKDFEKLYNHYFKVIDKSLDMEEK